jgi:hypothetical protein
MPNLMSHRTGTLRALLAAVEIGTGRSTTGLRESRPGCGLRQQRRVHALFGRARHHASIAIEKYTYYRIYTYFHIQISDTYAYTFLPRHAYAPGVACCTRWSAGSAAAVGTHTHGRTTKAACAHHIVPLSAPDASLRYMIDTSTCHLFDYVCIYMYIYFLYGSAVIRAGGTTAHPGAVATVLHGCLALIRAIGTTAHPGAVATVLHGCLALIRAIGTRRTVFSSGSSRLARRTGTQ